MTIAATSATNPEGNSGTTPFTFTVTRTNNTTGATTVDYAITGSGANAANAADFGGTLPSGTVSFAAGETTKTITVNVSGDVTVEPTETFTVTLSNPSSPATITTATATGTITNDDFTDTDGDGVADATDLDDDNDGIPDTVEDAQLTADVDGDGIPNRLDLDSDNDGISDLMESGNAPAILADTNGDGTISNTESPAGANGIPLAAESGTEGGVVPTAVDTDGDTKTDPYDLDSDNDGIFDVVEGGNGALDTNNDGVITPTDGGYADVDGDGIPDGIDSNTAVFGGTDTPSVIPDSDGDGIKDFRELDSDNDGIKDLVESGYGLPDTNADGKVDGTDTDGDGLINVPILDANTTFGGGPINEATLTDANNNSIPDYQEAKDTDGDGVPDITDLDDDNDGILDTVEDAQLTADIDGDGIPNSLDLDSDNDGINDVIEAGGTDSDKDGIADGTPNPTTGIPASAGSGSTPPDTDGDTRPNPYDLDSDSNGTPDYIQGNGASLTIAPTNATNPEGNSGTTPFTFTVTRSGNTTGATTVNWAVTGSGTNPADATDFGGTLPTGTVSFAAGETTKTITVNVSGDATVEPNETFTVTLSSPSGAATLTTATGTITNDDVVSAGVKLAVKVFLQGAYDSVAYTMRDDLRSRGFIPSAQPYNTALSSRFSQHIGTETVAPSVLAVTGNNAIVDWVYVDLRDANDSTFVVATRAALVQRDGDVVDLDGVSPVLFSSATPASYFISVNQRNHLGALTKQAIALSATVTTVDFTTTALQLAGTYPTKTYTTSGKRALWGGNANSDKRLIFQGPTNDADRVKDDILFALGNPNGDFSYIETGYRQGDINMDGDVKYQGPSNDLDAILFFNIVLYPTNTTYIPIYIMYERIP